MNEANPYAKLEYAEDIAGVDERRFWIIAPAIAQAFHWALLLEDEPDERTPKDAGAREEYLLECADAIFSYAAQEDLTGPQLEKIYEYTTDES